MMDKVVGQDKAVPGYYRLKRMVYTSIPGASPVLALFQRRNESEWRVDNATAERLSLRPLEHTAPLAESHVLLRRNAQM